MNVNFFDTPCKEAPCKDKQFGLCDDQDQAKAYSDVINPAKWITTVSNENEKEVIFTPLDKCVYILKPGTKDEESLCDGMLTFPESLFLVELKEKGPGGWIADAKGQLENTIRLMWENQDLTHFRYKKAYACNKKHPSFTVISNSESRAFFERTKGFRLDVNTSILIK